MVGKRGLLAAGLLLAATASLGAGISDAPAPPRRVLHVHLPEDIVTLDWNQSVHEVDLPLILNLQEGLTHLDRDLKAVPAIAEKWTFDSTGTQLKFKLRSNARWSDGKPVTAHDFVATFKRILMPTNHFSTAYFLYPIVGAEDFANGRVSKFEDVGVKATSDTTLEVNFKDPSWRWPEVTAVPALFPVRQDLIDDKPDSWAAPGMVTNGPFKYVSHTLSKDFLLRTRDDFPGRTSNIDEVRLHIMEFGEAVKAFKEGKLDVIFRLPRRFLSVFKSRNDARIYENRVNRTRKLDINKERYPMSSIAVRRSIAEAIDRVEMLKRIGAPYVAATSLIPEGFTGYQKKGGVPFNANQAKRDFSSGVTGEEKAKIDILVPAFDDSKEEDRELAIELKRQLEARLNVNVMLQFAENAKKYLALRDTQTYHLLLRDFNVDSGDPLNFYQAYASGSRFGMKWPDRKYDVLLQEASRAKTERELAQKIAAVDDFLLKETGTVIPLFYRGDLTVVRKNVQGFDSMAWQPYFLKSLNFIRGSSDD